jgi:hypothetical protein
MDKRYELYYCMVDPLFYDSPVAPQAGNFDYPIAGRPVPPGWQRFEQDDWLVYGPDETLTAGVELPGQGWKIHVSACLDNAEEILDEVWDYCVPRLISFKFRRAPHVLHMRNAKYASRGASGKLVTIYPENEKRLELVLTELGDILAGRPGPYILSDLRWGEGPLYVRYGGFAPRYCVSDRGVVEPAIEDSDGRLVPDRRTSARGGRSGSRSGGAVFGMRLIGAVGHGFEHVSGHVADRRRGLGGRFFRGVCRLQPACQPPKSQETADQEHAPG